MKHRLLVSAGIATCAILAVATRDRAQETPEKPIPRYGAKPWTEGTPEDAVAASRSGVTIPLSTYSISPTKVKEKKPLTGTIVGTSPFTTPLSGTTINAVVVPLIFNIGGTIFDPTAPNNCDSGYSAVNRFNASPMATPVPNLTFNGVNVGNVQYTDGFMRAEFWNTIKGSPAYSNPIDFSTASAITITADSANGITAGSGCTLLGVVSQTLITSQLASALQTLTASGLVSTAKFVLFLTSNVVGSTATPPTAPGTATCCTWGYHTASGSPPQFFAFAEYNTALPGTGLVVASHEIAEFMNDPLGTNAAPAWGGIGSASGCQGNLEVGDPLVDALYPGFVNPASPVPITLNGSTYYLQELAFFSWYFNSPATPSLGAGGKFSSHGTFAGPSKICPPGGTY
jgi:hypothetical protein